jgi:hypothetical protein
VSIPRILEPLPGERVLALAPATAEGATLHWLRRPNLFPGRALNAGALLQRQLWQAGHIAARGRDFVPGVVDGLEVAARDAADAESTGFDTTALQVGRGRALCASGEDVVLARALECRLADVPVVAPARFFDDGSGVADPTADGSLRERIVGDRLGALGAAARAALPAFGVLVLQPAAIEVASFDALDACDRTPWGDRNDTAASEDWRSRDALRLLWYVWPSEWVSSAAPPAQPRTPAQMRTLLAARIFAAETALAADECLPWEVFGAPVALVQLDLDAAVPLWLDRASVVRRGSRTRDARLRAGAQRLASHPRLPCGRRASSSSPRWSPPSATCRRPGWPRTSPTRCRRSACCRATPSTRPRGAATSSPSVSTSTRRRCRWTSSTSRCAPAPAWRR